MSARKLLGDLYIQVGATIEPSDVGVPANDVSNVPTKATFALIPPEADAITVPADDEA